MTTAKRALRRDMRAMRRALTDRPERSRIVVERLVELDPVGSAHRLLAYDAVPGEVETSALVEWCTAREIDVRTPEDDVDPTWPDVVVVPGVAFTRTGRRLGQGGGWYDRFLVGRRPGVPAIGIAFLPQLVDDLPTEPHDVILDCVVSEDGPHWTT